jgi:hypothetical protein
MNRSHESWEACLQVRQPVVTLGFDARFRLVMSFVASDIRIKRGAG